MRCKIKFKIKEIKLNSEYARLPLGSARSSMSSPITLVNLVEISFVEMKT